MHTYTHIYTHIQTHKHAHIHTHIYTHTHMYIHTYIHTYTPHTHIHVELNINKSRHRGHYLPQWFMFPNEKHTHIAFIFYHALIITLAGPLPNLHAVRIYLLPITPSHYVLILSSTLPALDTARQPSGPCYLALHMLVVPLCPACFSSMASLLSSTSPNALSLPTPPA